MFSSWRGFQRAKPGLVSVSTTCKRHCLIEKLDENGEQIEDGGDEIDVFHDLYSVLLQVTIASRREFALRANCAVLIFPPSSR